MKKILLTLLSLVTVSVFVAVAQQYGTAATVRIQTVAPVAQPIQIEVGRDIAKSVEIKQVPGNEIKIRDLPSAAVVVTPPPKIEVEPAHGHAHVETPTPTPLTTASPRSTP